MKSGRLRQCCEMARIWKTAWKMSSSLETCGACGLCSRLTDCPAGYLGWDPKWPSWYWAAIQAAAPESSKTTSGWGATNNELWCILSKGFNGMQQFWSSMWGEVICKNLWKCAALQIWSEISISRVKLSVGALVESGLCLAPQSELSG